MAYHINSLLSGQVPINDLYILHEEKFNLETGMKCHFQTKAKGNSTPYRLQFTLNRGSGFVFCSTRYERPSKEHCEKHFSISRKTQIITFAGHYENDKCFSAEYIYVTIECEQDISGQVQCVFGHAGFPKQFSDDIGSQRIDEMLAEDRDSIPSPMRKMTLISQFDSIIERANTACPDIARLYNTKRVNKNLDNFNPHVQDKHQKIMLLRDLLEQDDTMRKFLVSHKREIKKRYVILFKLILYRLNY